MELCDLCRSIPFGSLPVPDLDYESTYLIASNHELVQFYKSRNNNSPSWADGLGHPWHESLESLAEASKSNCPLCKIVQKGVQRWIDNYHSETKTNLLWREFSIRGEKIPYGQRLWLRRRFGRGDGFDIVVRQPADKNTLSLLTSIAFAAVASSSLACKFSLRPLEPDSSSKESLEVAASWLKTCVETHKNCPVKDSPLPSRVLDVGSSGDTIRLMNHTADVFGKYITLSYRWGKSNTLVTTKKSIQARITGISLSSLPKTFRDAVTITRYLGVRYLWIDSLCILQDQRRDWVRESAAMAKIYSQAYLTIAASHNRDSTDGCFHYREPLVSFDFNMPNAGQLRAELLSIEDQRIYDGWDFWDEPLHGRGWTLQERVLSRRILFYNTRQMYFECSDGIIGEDGARSDQRYIDLYENRSDDQNTERSRSSRSLWDQLLVSYGGRELTEATDKFPAISGLARLLGKRRDDEYVAGLWSGSLLEGLAWQCECDLMPTSTSQYIAPSWSWASYQGVANIGVQEDWHDIAEVIGWHIDLKDIENPYGEITDGWIRIRGPLAQLTPSKIAVTDHERRLHRSKVSPLPRFRTKHSEDENGAMVSFDHMNRSGFGEGHTSDLHVLILGGYSSKFDPNQKKEDHGSATKMGGGTQKHETKDADASTTLYGLVVAPSANVQEDSMKRLGWMFLEGSEAMRVVDEDACWKSVKLV